MWEILSLNIHIVQRTQILNANIFQHTLVEKLFHEGKFNQEFLKLHTVISAVTKYLAKYVLQQICYPAYQLATVLLNYPQKLSSHI